MRACWRGRRTNQDEPIPLYPAARGLGCRSEVETSYEQEAPHQLLGSGGGARPRDVPRRAPRCEPLEALPSRPGHGGGRDRRRDLGGRGVAAGRGRREQRLRRPAGGVGIHHHPSPVSITSPTCAWSAHTSSSVSGSGASFASTASSSRRASRPRLKSAMVSRASNATALHEKGLLSDEESQSWQGVYRRTSRFQ